MFKSGNIFWRQVVAIFFMCLFMAVHAVKLSHTHDEIRGSVKQSKHAVESYHEHAGKCAFCDYNFGQHADLCKIAISSVAFAKLPPVTQHVVASPITSIGSASSDRGPPAFYQ